MAQFFTIRWKRPRRAAPAPELNTYPATPAVLTAQGYPAWKAIETHKVARRVQLQGFPVLDEYTEVGAQEYPSWKTHFEKTRNATNHRLRVLPKLDSYPATPVVLTAQGYPAWAPPQTFKINFEHRLLKVLDPQVYPQVGIQGYPSWLPPKSNRAVFNRKLIRILEPHVYPITDVTVTAPGFGVGGIITNNGIGEIGLMANKGVGKAGEIVFGFGVGGIIKNQGIGKSGLITNKGIGKVGEI